MINDVFETAIITEFIVTCGGGGYASKKEKPVNSGLPYSTENELYPNVYAYEIAERISDIIPMSDIRFYEVYKKIVNAIIDMNLQSVDDV